jgi:hypothetical protein
MENKRMHPKPSLRFALMLLFLLLVPVAAHAQLDENCVVTILNRVSRVQPSGRWRVANVPANAGRVRARATCQKDGVTTVGQSGYFIVPANGVVDAIRIAFDDPQPVPATIVLTAPQTTFAAVGDTTQLTATVTLPGGATADVSNPAAGTTFRSSNADIATVSDTGLVTANGPGAAIISATNEGTLALVRVTVNGSADRDRDGMPDDWESANGLDPANPNDAGLDADGDGLTNRDEYLKGTNPRSVDSDGDGVTDGVEVQTGTSPIDPSSADLGRAVQSIAIQPSTISLILSPTSAEVSKQLKVVGTMLDGRSIDLTSRGTAYSSSDLAVVAFGSSTGLLIAAGNGMATITATNNGRSATATVQVRPLENVALSRLELDGWVKDLTVAGQYLYAHDSHSAYVVDVSNKVRPRRVAKLLVSNDEVNSVVVRGSYAYFSAGREGLAIVDVSNPAAPAIVSKLAVGHAHDVVLAGDYAYLADSDGLSIINVADSAHPVLAGRVAIAGVTVHIARTGTTAVIGTSSGDIVTVNVANPAAPAVLGRLHVAGYVWDVATSGNFAIVAGYTDGMRIVDFTVPSAPFEAASITQQFYPVAVAVHNGLAAFADILFVNSIPIVDVTEPAVPRFTAALDLTTFGDANGDAIAIDDTYAYLTAGSTLMIAQHSVPPDGAGIAPVITISQPTPGQPVITGEQPRVSVDVTDDVAVASIRVTMNGQDVPALARAPHVTQVTLPSGATSVTFAVTATDFGGNTSQFQQTHNVSPTDPKTTAVGRVLTADYAPAVGATVAVGGATGYTDADGAFRVAGASSMSDLRVQVAYTGNGQNLVGYTPYVPPVRGGETRFNDIVLPRGLGISLTSSLTGTTLVVGQKLVFVLNVWSEDGSGVSSVEIAFNGNSLGSVWPFPYNGNYIVPSGITTLTLTAVARDNNGNSLAATPLIFDVIPDPLTTVVGRVLTNDGTPVAGATVTSTPPGATPPATGNISTTTDVNGAFHFDDMPTTDVYQLYATYTAGEITYRGAAPAVTPVRGGTTTIPDILLGPGPKITLVPSIPLGTTLVHNEPFSFTIDGSADPGETLTEVRGYVNGESKWWFGNSSSLPSSRSTTIPADISTYVLEIVATDSRGNKARSALSYDVAPDPGSTLTGTVRASDGTPVAGALVTARRTLGDNVLGYEGQFLGPLGAVETTTDAQGHYTLTGVSTIIGDVIVKATKASATGGLTGESATVHPVRSGTVPVPAFTITEPGAVLAQIPVDTFSNWTEIQGQKLAVGNGGAVHFLDLANPVRPKLRGSLILADWEWVNAIKFTADGNRAVILMDDPKLVIADVTNLDTPTVLGELELAGDGWPLSAVIDGSIVAVACDDLILVDISNPGSPVEVGRLTLPGDVDYVALSGHTVIASDSNGVSVVDITDPANPVLRSRTLVTQRLDTVVAAGTRAYLTGANELAMLDFADPVHPILTPSATPLSPFATWIVTKAGNRLFVGGDPGPAEGRIEIVSLSTPEAPSHTGSISDVTMAPYRPGWLSATDQYLAVTGWYRRNDPRAHPEAGSMIYIVRIPEPTP